MSCFHSTVRRMKKIPSLNWSDPWLDVAKIPFNYSMISLRESPPIGGGGEAQVCPSSQRVLHNFVFAREGRWRLLILKVLEMSKRMGVVLEIFPSRFPSFFSSAPFLMSVREIDIYTYKGQIHPLRCATGATYIHIRVKSTRCPSFLFSFSNARVITLSNPVYNSMNP